MSIPQFPFSLDCLPFLNWNEEEHDSVHEKAVVFQSLVATVKLQTALNASLEAKAVNFLKYVNPEDQESADAFLSNFGPATDESLKIFIQSIVVLLSTTSQTFTVAAMKIQKNVIMHSSPKHHLALIKADIIPQIITTLNPLSLPLTEAADIHTHLISTITDSFWLPTTIFLSQLGFQDSNGQQTVHGTILRQVLAPSEKYICHLCVNRYSILVAGQCMSFLALFANLLKICTYSQPTMDFVLQMPVFLTIGSCLTFFEKEESNFVFLDLMADAQWEWNKNDGKVGQMWKTVQRMLRMEGIEDAIEEKLRNDKNEDLGGLIVENSIRWNNLQGMNLPRRW
ncbi:hypothetical protein BLNAU_8230 [Blattamonas nauphoetae]|uniref:Uncharacterized protein n=1 Tax=Blattamonas nauphoetae TaxID=2049346 RepID=A0ABQ9XZ42_9EUKA|nr:hypothetical protein BLNAU_8230 [Blattamonas nauphoetae]